MPDYESVSASLTDEARIERWEAIVADHDDSKSDLIRQLIDDEYERRDLDTAPDPAEEDEDTGHWYDPHEDIDEPLDGDDLREILWEYDRPEINPDHLMGRNIPMKNQGEKEEVLAAVARYRGIEPTRDTVDRVIEATIGTGRDSHNIRTYRSPVLDILRGEHAPMVSHATKVAGTTDDEWLETTRRVVEKVENDDYPDDVAENRAEAAREMLAAAPDDHPQREEFEAAIEELEAEAGDVDGPDDTDDTTDDTDDDDDLMDDLDRIQQAQRAAAEDDEE